MKLRNEKLYIGILIKAGQVEQLMVYDSPEECRDNVADSLNYDSEGISYAGVWLVSDEFFPDQVGGEVMNLTPYQLP